MTNIRKTKKNNAKLFVQLFEMHTYSKVKHYSRFARRYKKYLWQDTTSLLEWQLELTKLQRAISDVLSSQVRCCFDTQNLRFSRDKIINGDGYYWLPSDGNLHASCLGISPALLYGEPTLSSLADSGLIRSPSIIPLEAKLELDRMHRFIKLQAKGGHK